MKYKSMYVLLLLLLAVLIIGRVVVLDSESEVGVKNDNKEKQLSEKQEQKENIAKETKTETASHKENLLKEEKESSVVEDFNERFLKGDIDNDGKVSITDVSILNKHISENKEIESSKIDLADINNDGKITITDLSGLNQIVIKNSI